MSDALQEEKTLQQPDTQQQGIESQISMDRPIPVLIIQSHPDLIRVGDIARLEALLDNQVIELVRGKLDFCRGDITIVQDSEFIKETLVRFFDMFLN